METLDYRRDGFATRLPREFRYTLSHAWLAPCPGRPGRWRVGLTRFALLLLGELVELRIEATSGQAFAPGQVLGSIEGFKSVSDLAAPARGVFVHTNPALADGLEPIARDVHGTWLYELDQVDGPAEGCLDAIDYARVLDVTISRMTHCRMAPPDPGEASDPPA